MGFMTRLRSGIAQIISPNNLLTPRANIINSMPVHELKRAVTGLDINEMLPGFSQPVWGPELNTVGAYSHEGYTSKTFDKPIIPFNSMALALATDEDVSLALNHLSSQVTGGEHYWSGLNEAIVNHISEFSHEMNFDEMDTILVKELLWYGNSFWKPRMGITNLRSMNDLMHIPISSAVRIWWDRQRIPYKYEFRGAEYQGYHNPDEILHFAWNPINASVFGNGFGVAMMAPHTFMQITANGPEQNALPSLLDRKYSNQLTMHVTERRYTPRNVYIAKEADADERAQLQSQIQDLRLGEDLVAGSALEVTELGSSQRAFNPTQFTDTVQGPIFKALNDFRGKQGSESSHQYANAKQSAILDEIGLSAFPLAVTRMLIDKIFKPWYNANPTVDPLYGGGMISMPWDDCQYELNFGRVTKADIQLEDQIKLIELAISSMAVQDPLEIRDLLEDAGLGLRKEYGDQMAIQYNNYNAVPPDMSMDSGMNFDNQMMGNPPMDNPIYDSMMMDVRGASTPNVQSPMPSDPRLQMTLSEGGIGSGRKKTFPHGMPTPDVPTQPRTAKAKPAMPSRSFPPVKPKGRMI